MKQIKKQKPYHKCRCVRDGYEWYPRAPKRPKQCPCCHSSYWDIKPIRQKRDHHNENVAETQPQPINDIAERD